MKGTFPALETLELHNSSPTIASARLPGTFKAPNLRHLRLSDSTLGYWLLLSSATTIPTSLVSFSLGEVTFPPGLLIECLSLLPHLKSLNIGYLFPVEGTRDDAPDQADQQVSAPLVLPNLEELQFQGVCNYFERLAAQICAPLLKKLSITFSDGPSASGVGLHLSQLIDGAPNLKFNFARVRFKDGVSIVLDHNELWAGRGALELRFKMHLLILDQQIALAAQVCDRLASTLSTVQSLLLEYAEHPPQHCIDARWYEVLRHFDNVKTLRLAHCLVDDLGQLLRPDDEGKVLTLLPRLQEIVCYGPDEGFSAFVEARRLAGRPVHIVSGPKNRLWLV